MSELKERLEEFFEYCFDGMGRSERRGALANYLRALLLSGDRKTVLPMARSLCGEDDKVEAMRQRLQQAVTVANWDERELHRRVALRVDEELPGVEAFVVDDTGFPKKGRRSVGVQRQYSGTLGRIDNCQVAASLHMASELGGACIGMRLALPKSWADDPERRAEVGVPDEIEHRTKSRLALDMLDDALAWGLEPMPVIADAGYGDSIAFREGLRKRGLEYVVRVSGTAVVWPPGTCPTPPPPRRKGARGRPRTKWISPDGVAPISIAALAESLPSKQFRSITWRQGTRGPQKRRFTALRVRTAHRHCSGHPPGDEQWLLCAWSFKEQKPTAFYLSNLPPNTTRKRLVYLAKLRWRIERDYQEMKSELGLDHFEGRTWRGFHHHVALVAAAHAFLTLARASFPPEWLEGTDVSGLQAGFASGASLHGWSLPDVPPHDHAEGPTEGALADVIK
ncbi:MAG: IS701 family transposase [Myxococcota bacterium]